MSARQRVTVVVWIAGMLAAATLIARRPTVQIRGLAEGESVVIAAPSDGMLAELKIVLHQVVEAGDLLATLDGHRLQARHRVQSAEIEALTMAQIAERQGRSRLFQRDREQAGFQLAELNARVLEGEAELQALRQQLSIDQRLVAEGLVAPNVVVTARNELQVVETRLAADSERLKLARRNLSQASVRAAAAPKANDWQVEAARRELLEIERQIESLALRAPIAGQVSEIYRRRGESLGSGEPVVRISPMAANDVHLWLDSATAAHIEIEMEATIRRGDGRRLTGRVVSIGAERLQIPRTLWARVDAPEWGYPVRVSVSDSDLAPGEPVLVALRPLGQSNG